MGRIGRLSQLCFWDSAVTCGSLLYEIYMKTATKWLAGTIRIRTTFWKFQERAPSWIYFWQLNIPVWAYTFHILWLTSVCEFGDEQLVENNRFWKFNQVHCSTIKWFPSYVDNYRYCSRQRNSRVKNLVCSMVWEIL